MIRTKIVLLVSILLTFAAGGAVGVLAARAHRPPHRSWLTAELNLSAEQREQMQKIWSEAMGSGFRQQGERRTALAQERDRAIAALLSDEQRTQYQALQQEHSRKMDELSQERKSAFAEAVERTKKILTPEQAAKYDELMKKQRGGGRGGRPEFSGPRHREPGPSTAPAKAEPTTPQDRE